MKLVEPSDPELQKQHLLKLEDQKRSLVVQEMLDQHSKKYRKFNGLVFFRPDSTVGYKFAGTGVASILGSLIIPQDTILPLVFIATGLIYMTYAGLHIFKARANKKP